MFSSAQRLLAILPILLLALAGTLATADGAAAESPTTLPNIAFYYGKQPPLDELSAFDMVVVEPDNVSLADLAASRPDVPSRGPGWLGQHTELLAYVSVGELHPTRAYFNQLPATWRAGTNPAWNSVVIDQSQPDWPAWFVEHAVAPLWQAGYRGFFLDTLDSFNLVAKTDAERARQAEGLARTVRAIKAAFPEAKLVFNRGFEILPQVHELAAAVAAESLFQGWNAEINNYQEVSDADRSWLLGQLNVIKDKYHLPVIAIDYVAPGKRDLARDTARRIAALGYVPWVTNPALDMLGVGAIEVMPRKVLVLYDGQSSDVGVTYEPAHRFLAMPLNYLGYTVVYQEARKPLPTHVLAGRYAGIVTLFAADTPSPGIAPFLKSAISQGLRIASFGTLGVPRGEVLRDTLGLLARDPERAPVRRTLNCNTVRLATPPYGE